MIFPIRIHRACIRMSRQPYKKSCFLSTSVMHTGDTSFKNYVLLSCIRIVVNAGIKLKKKSITKMEVRFKHNESVALLLGLNSK